jgi:hypothetical protein
MVLLEVDDAVGVLHDGAIGGTGDQAARLFAMHALILAHQQHEVAAFGLDLVELDQIPVIPRRLGHGLIAVLEGGIGGEGEAIPLLAGDLAGLAADASRGVDQLADLELPLEAGAGNGARMA